MSPLPWTGRDVPAPRRHGRGSWWRYGLPLLTLAAILGGTVLTREAVQAISDSNDGDFSANITDPSQPGWEARLEATPAMLVLVTDSNGQLSMVAILARPTPESGGEIIVVPPETSVGDTTLAAIHRADGPQAAGDAVETLTTVALETRQLVAADSWPSLISPVAPLTLDLADPLVRSGDDETSVETLLQAGTIELAADQIDLFVSHVNPAASPLERQRRQRGFWMQWLTAIAASDDPNAVPGEAEGGFGAFMRAIASGVNDVVEYELVPGASTADPLLPGPTAAAQIATAIPFPRTPAPGIRPRTRVLDGSGVGQTELSGLARRLAAAGAEITVIGNADSFAVETSALIYYDPAYESVVARLAQVIPGAEVRFEPIEDTAIDLTVIWGEAPAELATPTAGEDG